MIAFDDHIDAESARFAAVVAALPADAPVPSAPGWVAADLVWHLSEVQLFWAAIAAGRHDAPDAADASAPDRPGSYPELRALFDRATIALTGALDGVDDAEPMWTWAEDRSAGFVRRRQAHEALIHRVDAELAAGDLTAVNPDLAVDGIDEILVVFLATTPSWATFTADGTTIAVEATGTGRRWTLRFGRMTGTSPSTGRTYDIPALDSATSDAAPGTTVAGAAADLLLWLWGRGPIDALTVDGDPDGADRLRAAVVESTQ